MEKDEIYMHRCLQLARKGSGFTTPNPLVGAVIVYENKIIGEGFHKCYGEAHAEVNAINSVKDPALLSKSTMYVSLEPCSHYGKTPPCAELIISKGIPHVVIATLDPNPQVSGRGVRMLKEANIKVDSGILEIEAKDLNYPFFVNQLYNRPYILLKWAQSKDGYIDKIRNPFTEEKPARLSNDMTQIIVHKYRSRIQAILVGTNTAILDNPRLNTRNWFGKNPVRITIDRNGKIPHDSQIFNESAPTIVLTEKNEYIANKSNVKSIQIPNEHITTIQMLNYLFKNDIYSIMVEGGSRLLTSFISENIWDDAIVETSEQYLYEGVKAPEIEGEIVSSRKYFNSSQTILKKIN